MKLKIGNNFAGIQGRACRDILTLTVSVLVVLSTVSQHVYGDEPRLTNDGVELRFDLNDGQMVGLADLSNRHEFIEAPSSGGLWQLQPRDRTRAALLPEHAETFSWSRESEELTLTWAGFAIAGAPDLRVIVTVTLPEQSRTTQWWMRLEGFGDLRLEEVRFPRLPAITAQSQEVLAVPVWMGEMARDPRRVLGAGRREWEWPGTLSLQCLALYRDMGPGLFLSCADTEGFRKRFAVAGDEEGALGFELIHLPVDTADGAGAYETPYDALVGVFEGDWFTVAETYRDWPWNRRRAETSTMDAGTVPDWVRDTGLWVWNRGASPGVLEPAAALQEAAGLPVSVFWHWWHGCPYDVGFPEYLPPREGSEPFRQALDAAHARGLHAIVYMNQRLWGMTTESWTAEGAEQFAVKGPDGNVHREVYNTFMPAPMAPMCMGTAFWRDKYAGLAVTAASDLGVDGIYMDQACASLSCYDPAHGHPLGGGTYWIDGFQMLAKDIRARADGVALAGEGCGEAWLPYLDMMLMLQVSKERYSGPNQWEPIPFFQAVYGGHAVFFGNYSSLTMPPYDELWPAEFAPAEPLKLLDRKYAAQFRLEHARSFAWGQQPAIANFRPSHLDDRPEEMDFFLTLARLRHQAVKYLQHGRMLRPPRLDLPPVELEMSRLSIYAGQREGLKEFSAPYAPIVASAWQADDGSIAIPLVNITDQPQEVVVPLDAYPLPNAAAVHRLDDTTRTFMIDIDRSTPSVTVRLEPTDARLIEITPR